MGYGMDDEDWGRQAEDHFEEQEAEQKFLYTENKRTEMCKRYNDAKNAETGTTIRCPFCNKAIVKSTYNKVFCSNGRTRKNKNCKDGYWNFVPIARRERASTFIKGN